MNGAVDHGDEMRLICPNCGAQYEVPTNVIPEGGRDVQCSNCGHTWFQAHPDDDTDLTGELGHGLPDDDWKADLPPEPPAPEPEAEPDPETISEPETAPEEEPEPLPVAPRPRKPRSLDPSVAEVLRAEAEREARNRAADTLETQPELGLQAPDEDDAARRAREARERMSALRSEDTAASLPGDESTAPVATSAATAASTRRELLPDIEEINQTLRATERRGMETPQGRAVLEDEEKTERSGFANGFRLVLAIAIIAIALYLLAPKIAGIFPGAEPFLTAYVAKIDALRLWLDGQVTALLQMFGGAPTE